MSLFDFWWNTVQSGQLDDLQEQNENLKQRIVVAEQWIVYLNNELEKVKNERRTETIMY